jgi:uncharacterized glyoxalase superfamily protein PhnB
MIDGLCEAFGFEVRLKVEGKDGDIAHSELTYGEGLIMVHGERDQDERWRQWGVKALSPLTTGAMTQSMMVFVDDVDSHCEHARKCSARIVDEPSVHDYGEDYWTDRSYGAVDPEGHMWWFTQRLRSGPKA